MKFDEVWKIASGVEGWLDEANAKAMFDCARDKIAGDIMEVGSYRGRSTTVLAAAALTKKVKLWVVDPFYIDDAFPGDPDSSVSDVNTFCDFFRKMKEFGFWDDMHFMRGTSEEIGAHWDGLLSFIFVDAHHTYEHVKRDFEIWSPKIADDGYFVFHDTDCLPVKRFLDELKVDPQKAGFTEHTEMYNGVFKRNR